MVRAAGGCRGVGVCRSQGEGQTMKQSLIWRDRMLAGCNLVIPLLWHSHPAALTIPGALLYIASSLGLI